MSKRTVLLIVGLFLITASLIWIATYVNQQPGIPVSTAPSLPQPTVSHAQSVLSFSPSLLNLSSSSGTLSINLSTGTNKATAVQLDLSYDPAAIAAIDIAPGTFFPNSLVLLKTIDKTKGKITFAFGISPAATPVTGTGTVATLTLTLAPTAKQTAITVLPTTLVSAAGETKTVLKQATGATIVKTQTSSAPLSPAPTR